VFAINLICNNSTLHNCIICLLNTLCIPDQLAQYHQELNGDISSYPLVVKNLLQKQQEYKKYIPPIMRPLYQVKDTPKKQKVESQKWQDDNVEIDPLFFRDIALNSIPASRSEEGNN
jgi:hypothetical protein